MNLIRWISELTFFPSSLPLMSEPCQGPAGKTGVAEEIVKGVDGVVYVNLEKLEEVSARQGGNEY